MRYVFSYLLSSLIFIGVCWHALPAAAAVSNGANPSPPAVESSHAQVQLSDVYWGNVQVAQLRWARATGSAAHRGTAANTHLPDSGQSWWAELVNVQLATEDPQQAALMLGNVYLRCQNGAAKALWACAQGDWRWQSPTGLEYQGQWWAHLPSNASTAWFELSAAGFQLQLKGEGDDLTWAVQLETADLNQWLPWWPANLATQAAVWRGGMQLKASGGLNQAELKFNLQGMDFDSADGLIASGGLDLHLDAQLAWQGDYWQVQSSGSLGPGAILWNDLYLDLNERMAQFELNLGARPSAGEWFIEHLAWRDPPALSLVGHGRWADGSVHELQVEELTLDLARLNAAYLSGWLARAALSDLQLAGQIVGALSWSEQALQSFRFQLQDVAVADGRRRFTLEGLAGELSLAPEIGSSGAFGVMPGVQESAGLSGDASSLSQLRWDALSVWGLDSGPSQLQGRLQPRAFELSASTRLPLLDGALRLDQFRAERDSAGEWQLSLGAELEPISMAQLTAALGWPAFGGRVAGRLPGAHYENGVLRLDGALDFEIFSGRVALSHLALERTFASLPSLSADLSIQSLDLEALTQAFSFGRITGLLDGEVNQLRLLNWRPVSFDAWIESSGKGGRISQRAVDNLSRIGGGGGAALGGIVGMLFDEFPYRRLGLSCRLHNNVCHMNGADRHAAPGPIIGPNGALQGYDIVVGRSLPRISIKGFQRQVDWPTLVKQLQQIIAGPGSPELR